VAPRRAGAAARRRQRQSDAQREESIKKRERSAASALPSLSCYGAQQSQCRHDGAAARLAVQRRRGAAFLLFSRQLGCGGARSSVVGARGGMQQSGKARRGYNTRCAKRNTARMNGALATSAHRMRARHGKPRVSATLKRRR